MVLKFNFLLMFSQKICEIVKFKHILILIKIFVFQRDKILFSSFLELIKPMVVFFLMYIIQYKFGEIYFDFSRILETTSFRHKKCLKNIDKIM